MIKDNVKDLKDGRPEIPEVIATDRDELKIIPESHKDLDPMFRIRYPHLNGRRVSFL
jgi:hypothetical protein